MRAAMRAMGKACQAMIAGGGFFSGYVWGVTAWARGAGPGDEALVRAALAPGGALSAAYALALGWLFWECLPAPRMVGLRAIASPVAFTLSFLAGGLGIRGALWFLAG